MRQLPAPAVANDYAPTIDRVQSRVDAAAFALLREGRNPTVTLVRERMGGASPNAVAPALQRWRLTFAAQLDENAGSALDVLPPGVLELVQALWSRALFEAHRVRADSPSAAEALNQLSAAISELRDHAARLQAREAEVDAQLRGLDEQRRRLGVVESKLTRRQAVRPIAKARPSDRQQRPTPLKAGRKSPPSSRSKPRTPAAKRPIARSIRRTVTSKRR